jgi:hypothetical protein
MREAVSEQLEVERHLAVQVALRWLVLFGKDPFSFSVLLALLTSSFNLNVSRWATSDVSYGRSLRERPGDVHPAAARKHWTN